MPAAPKDKTPKKPERKVVQVRATKLGFYGNMLRPPGTVFNVKIGPDEKWPSWVEEVVDGESPEKSAESKSDASNESKGSSSDDVI